MRPTPITDAAVANLKDWFGKKDIVDADEMRDLERQLAAKTEECEGWEKQWRDATMHGLTDKTRDELAEVREQRDRLAEALREMRYGHTDKAERMAVAALAFLEDVRPLAPADNQTPTTHENV